jgi:hypothetical protein
LQGSRERRRNRAGASDITRAREVVCDVLVDGHEHHSTGEPLDRCFLPFLPFAAAARR